MIHLPLPVIHVDPSMKAYEHLMIYDITPPITTELRVWPGDTPLHPQPDQETANGKPSPPPSALSATVHLGAHADAPNHFGVGEKGIDQCDLERYLGPCQVIRAAISPGGALHPEQVKTPVISQRVLFATGTYPDPTCFNEDFAGFSATLIDWLHEKGVILVGIDTPSIDLFATTNMPAHKALLRHEMANLEGLALRDVPEGMYELIALPLKLVGFDASPVRAVLRTPS